MMQRMPGVTDQANAMFDPEQLQFQQTGATEQIGLWSAFEVEMTDPTGERVTLVERSMTYRASWPAMWRGSRKVTSQISRR